MNFSAPLVVGMGVTGLSCVRFLEEFPALSVYDTRDVEHPAVQEGLRALRLSRPKARVFSGSQVSEALDSVDVLIASPGVRADADIFSNARDRDLPILSDLDLFAQAAKAPLLGITGTNGKSTITELAGQMLYAQGYRRGGNLGVPALDLLDEQASGYVLELSSFQLEQLGTCRLEVGAMANVSVDHLDRHGSLLRYLEAKRRIYRDCGFAVYNGDDPWTHPPKTISSIGVNSDPVWRVTPEGAVIDGRQIAERDIAIKGLHNRFNAVMASAVAHREGAGQEEIMGVLGSFEGLQHRSRPVRDRRGVRYVNDSKATNVSAAVAAMTGFGTRHRNLVVLLGGDGKGADFEPLANAARAFVKHVICFGGDGGRIREAVGSATASSMFPSMIPAIREAARIATSGDVVLLSPGCASFDEFQDFRDRGDVFERMVQAMEP